MKPLLGLIVLLLLPSQASSIPTIYTQEIQTHLTNTSYIQAVWVSGLIEGVSRSQGVDPNLAWALAASESALKADCVGDKYLLHHAYGLFQLQLGTAREVAFNLKIPGKITPTRLLTDEYLNVKLGVAVLGWCLKENHGDYLKAIAAYKAGQDGMEAGRGFESAVEVMNIYGRLSKITNQN